MLYCFNEKMAEELLAKGKKLMKQLKDTNGKDVWIFEASIGDLSQNFSESEDYVFSNRLSF